MRTTSNARGQKAFNAADKDKSGTIDSHEAAIFIQKTRMAETDGTHRVSRAAILKTPQHPVSIFQGKNIVLINIRRLW